ncbi:MAG: TlpA family protein disulfide reductase [Candidatus Paracaedibacteraceae bacterium]|nr:TlpA family protein disulfide reductase [Candidatus Paracaedibacteraceae bacterium]
MVISNKPFWIGVILSPILLAVVWFAVNKPKVETTTSVPSPTATFDFIPTTEKKELSRKPFEKLNLEDGSTTSVSFKDLAGKPMIVHYWATWCGACVEEMPTLAKFAEQHGEQIRFIIIASDTSGGKEVLDYCKTNGITNIEIFIDAKGRVVKDQGIKALPTTIFASADAVEAGRVVGAIDWLGQSGTVIASYLTKGA